MTGRLIPIDHDSNVIIWNKEYIDFPMEPNHAGKFSPKRVVPIIAKNEAALKELK